jgi:hypothetical protein
VGECFCVSVNKQECLFVLQEICVNFVTFGCEDCNHLLGIDCQLPSWVDSWAVAVVTNLSKACVCFKEYLPKKIY